MRRVVFRSRMRRLPWLPATVGLPLGTCAAPDARVAGFSLQGKSRCFLPGIVALPSSDVRAAVLPDGGPSVDPAHPHMLLFAGHRERSLGPAAIRAIDCVAR